jgi:protein involved in polysaccharide export with SLBB domain
MKTIFPTPTTSIASTPTRPFDGVAWRHLLLLALALLLVQQPVSAGLDDYRLSAGDRIRIQVYDEPDLTLEAEVRDRGIITYPFLGEIQIKGKTVREIESFITSGLKGPYLVNPDVTVSIVEYRPFFVNGRVQNPGGFPYQPGMTVGKAISLAGGFEERAAQDQIYMVSENNATPRKVSLETEVRPGDIITVKRSFF